jgi:proteic killer suppression protein
MIGSYRCSDTLALANGFRVRRFQAFETIARRKLRQLDIASTLDDLRIPPGNRLELLRGNRRGQHSIRINDQYRLCFHWVDSQAEDVEIVDYH